MKLLYLLTTKYRDGHTTLVKSFYNYIVDTGCDILFKNYVKEFESEQQQQITTFSSVDQKDVAKPPSKKYLQNYYDNRVVNILINFKTKLDTIVEECFRGHNSFKYKLKDAFEVFMNKKTEDLNLISRQPAEIIAKFIDCKMRNKNYILKINAISDPKTQNQPPTSETQAINSTNLMRLSQTLIKSTNSEENL